MLRWLPVALATVLAAAVPALVTPAPPAGAAPLAAGPVIASGGRCADVAGGGSANGAAVQLWDCNGAGVQQWSVHDDGTVRAMGRCLDVPGDSTANGTPLWIYDCNGLPFQKWVPRPDGSLLNPNSGRCLDVPDGVFANGARLRIWDCNGSTAQVWITPPGATDSAFIVGNGDKCVDVTSSASVNGAQVQLYECNGKPWQRFTLGPDNSVRVLDRCVEVPGGQTAAGSRVQVWDCNGAPNQRWLPRADGSLFNPASGRCLDDPNGVTANGTPLRLWDCNGLAPQRWRVPAVTGATTITVDTTAAGTPTSPDAYGYILEDISHSVEGGLYGELVRNRALQEGDLTGWRSLPLGGAGAIALDGSGPTPQLTRSLRLDITRAGPTASVGAANSGFWGVAVRPSTRYQVSLWARATPGFTGPLTASLRGTDGVVHASAQLTGLTGGWRRLTTTLQTSAQAPTTSAAEIVISAGGCTGCPEIRNQSVWLSLVSVFPPTHKGRANGIRTDLAGLLEAGRPALFRVPGGNYLEGATLDTRFKWKETVGPVENRPGHQNTAWGYWSTDGMGLLEHLQLAEDLGAEPLLGVFAGYTLNGTVVPQDQLGPYIQEVLDQLEYVLGPTTSPWGARRAADGHPAPFPLRYVEIGNEDWFDRSGSYDRYRYAAFHDAIKARYPHLRLVATMPVTTRRPDVLDEHFYQSPTWFADNAHRYDHQAPDAPKVLVGEYGAIEGSPTGTFDAALGEAAFLVGVERNPQTVIGSMYAPILVNENASNWPTNLIGFDATRAYGSPSYWVQRVFAESTGTTLLPTRTTGGGAELHHTATASASGGTRTVHLKLVNTRPVARDVTLDLSAATPASGNATVTTVSGPRDAVNSLTRPTRVAPVTRQVAVSGPRLTTTLPAHSVTVVTLVLRS
ncbi:ricin-type beta-trefoil lectin domain protein [Lentzea sp. NPDC058436]|uniref:ricin-type beta-trefoil lectin domain protein n=1 Tax=Lentzea sp. NPDC058436 TaxID=3346499 RepID=UPI003662EC63